MMRVAIFEKMTHAGGESQKQGIKHRYTRAPIARNTPLFFMLATCAVGSDRVALAIIASTARNQWASERAH
jgi:hypothetical protein